MEKIESNDLDPYEPGDAAEFVDLRFGKGRVRPERSFLALRLNGIPLDPEILLRHEWIVIGLVERTLCCALLCNNH